MTGPLRTQRAWFARLTRVGAAEVRLFCLAQAGGGGATFRAWTHNLPPSIDLCAVRLPGRESRRDEPPISRMEELVTALAAEIEEYVDLPFALFGYCSGALTAFELARHLARTGRPTPVRLFACASPAPRLTQRDVTVHRLPPAAFREHLRSIGLIPAAILDEPTLFALFEQGVRADFEVIETMAYQPAPPLDLPITVIGARHDQTLTFEQLIAWREETRRAFTLRLFPGQHSFFETEREHLVRGIVADLAEHGRVR